MMEKNTAVGISDVSTREIAAVVGCSHSSVSRALRGKRKVGAALRQRILAAAKEMGYRPNPMVASLMAVHNRKRDRRTLSANIGWINTNPNKRFWHEQPYNQIFIETAKRRARENGFGFEEIWANEPGLTGRRFNEIALSRGIQGIIIPGASHTLLETGFDPSLFAIVSLRDDLPNEPSWHRAGTSGRKNAELAFLRLRSLGYRRIGILLGLSADGFSTGQLNLEELIHEFNAKEYVDHALLPLGFHKQLLAGYYYVQRSIAPSERIKPFCFNHRAVNCLDIVGDYLKRARLDAVLCHHNLVFDAVQRVGLRVPRDLALAHLNLGDDVPGWAGIEANSAQQSSAAIDLLCANVLRNERGIPQFAQFIHIEGEWRDGRTVRKTKKPASTV